MNAEPTLGDHDRQEWAVGLDLPRRRTPMMQRIVGGIVTTTLLVVLVAVLVKVCEVAWAWVA